MSDHACIVPRAGFLENRFKGVLRSAPLYFSRCSDPEEGGETVRVIAL